MANSLYSVWRRERGGRCLIVASFLAQTTSGMLTYPHWTKVGTSTGLEMGKFNLVTYGMLKYCNIQLILRSLFSLYMDQLLSDFWHVDIPSLEDQGENINRPVNG